MTFMYRSSQERDAARTGFTSLLDELQSGDCMVVERFAGVADSAAGFLEMMKELERRGIRLRSVEEKFDTGTEQGRYALGILEKVAALDNHSQAEPRPEASEERKDENRFKGRKPIEVDENIFDSILERWQRGEITARQAMNELNLKPNTFYRRVKERMADSGTTEQFLNAAKRIGKEIVAGVQAEAVELSDAAGKFATDYDVDTLANTVKDTLGKNLSAAGSIIDSISREWQAAANGQPKPKAESQAQPEQEEENTDPADESHEWI